MTINRKKTGKSPGADEHTRNLMQPLLLEQGKAPQIFASLLAFSSVFIAAIVIWASITQIRELTIAPGEIKPVGSLQHVQHLEGGMVLELMVKEGQIVERGAPLVRLQPTIASSDLEQLQVRHANFIMQERRLEAAIQNRKPDFGDFGIKYPGLARAQLAIMTHTIEQSVQERATLVARIKQRNIDVNSFTNQVGSLTRQVEIQSEQLKIRRELLKQGLVSKAAFLEARRIYEKTHGELLAMRGRLQAGLEALNEARIVRLELDASKKKKLVDERAKVAVELSELKQTLAKHKDRVSRLLVRAPIRGIVQELVPKATGEVIKPGDLVAKILPLDQELVAEVQVMPDDIGHIKIGDKAELKISTYDPARFGGVTGHVRNLSATTFRTQKGEPYYKAVIALSQNYVGAKNQGRLIMPGMVVSAEIVTGAKSLVRYLLKPIFRSVDVAFTER